MHDTRATCVPTPWLLATVLVGWPLLAPLPAHAHGAMPGMEGFGIGLVHPLITPAHLLLLLALGLWLGQHPPLRLRAAMVWFAPLSALGLALTTQFAVPAAWQVVLAALALGTAVWVISAARSTGWAQSSLAAVAGLAIGLDSGVDAGASATAVAVTLLATWIGMNLVLANVAYYTSLLPPQKWAGIAVRVAGSWIAAICLLVLAFALKPA